jgi:hypothetical protein
MRVGEALELSGGFAHWSRWERLDPARIAGARVEGGSIESRVEKACVEQLGKAREFGAFLWGEQAAQAHIGEKSLRIGDCLYAFSHAGELTGLREFLIENLPPQRARA